MPRKKSASNPRSRGYPLRGRLERLMAGEGGCPAAGKNGRMNWRADRGMLFSAQTGAIHP